MAVREKLCTVPVCSTNAAIPSTSAPSSRKLAAETVFFCHANSNSAIPATTKSHGVMWISPAATVQQISRAEVSAGILERRSDNAAKNRPQSTLGQPKAGVVGLCEGKENFFFGGPEVARFVPERSEAVQ